MLVVNISATISRVYTSNHSPVAAVAMIAILLNIVLVSLSIL